MRLDVDGCGLFRIEDGVPAGGSSMWNLCQHGGRGLHFRCMLAVIAPSRVLRKEDGENSRLHVRWDID